MSSPSYYWAALFSLALHGVLLVLPADSGAATPPRVEIPLELLWEAPVSQASQAPSTAGAAPLAAPASLSPSTPSAAAMQPSFASVQAAAPSDQVTGNLAAASAASSATAPPSPATGSTPAARRTAPCCLASFRPPYPSQARQNGQEGSVIIRVHIAADGSVSSLAVRRSSGYSSLDEAALNGVRQWRFAPARQGDHAVDGYFDVDVSFQLD